MHLALGCIAKGSTSGSGAPSSSLLPSLPAVLHIALLSWNHFLKHSNVVLGFELCLSSEDTMEQHGACGRAIFLGTPRSTVKQQHRGPGGSWLSFAGCSGGGDCPGQC